jgi:hypothetical protein
MSSLDVGCPLHQVIVGGWERRRILATGLRLAEHFAQERSTPTAAGSSPKAVRQLPRPLGSLHTQEVQHLAFAHVETDTQVLIQFHGPAP